MGWLVEFGGGVGGGGGGGGAIVGWGVGEGVGGGGSFTVTVGPRSGAGGSLEVALKITAHVPAGSVAVPCQVPSLALPLTLMSVTVAPATSAQTDWAGWLGLPVDA